MITGLARADGPESMLEGAAFNRKAKVLQSNNMKRLYTEVGGLTDQELEGVYFTTFGVEIRSNSVHARRNELVMAGIVAWTGERRSSPISGIKTMVWGLVEHISDDQMKRNAARRKGKQAAINFTMRLAKHQSAEEAIAFLGVWQHRDWTTITTRWPAFLQESTSNVTPEQYEQRVEFLDDFEWDFEQHDEE